MPWLFLLAVAANLFELATLTVIPWNGDTGLKWTSAGEPFELRVVSVRGPAAAAGFKVGDRIDLRQFFSVNGVARPVPGVPYHVMAHRGDLTVDRVLIPVQKPIDASQVIRLIAVFWIIAFAFLIATRGRQSRENGLLLAFLLLMAIESPLARMELPDTRLNYFANALNLIASSLGVALLVLYADCFGTPLPAWRRRVSYTAIATIGICLVSGLIVWAALYYYPFIDPYTGIGTALRWGPYAQALIGLVALGIAIPAARPDERQRIAWVFAAWLPFAVAVALANVQWSSRAFAGLQNASLFCIPAALTYAALAKRMFDVGFVVNRAAVFAGVSVVVVGAFVMVEWALGKWFENAGHATNLAVNAALALVLGLSIRLVHKRIDAAVDNVFFRKRHENEIALRRFAREAGFFTDPATLLDRAHATILAHSEAKSVEIVLAGDVDPNDAAVVTMRAWHEPVDLTSLATSLNGDTAFPMLARGEFVGAILCGSKRTGERYAPDEVEALRELAHGVGLALDIFERKSSDGISLAQISETLSLISSKLDYLRPEVQS